MKAMLGEEGTEQFTVETEIEGKRIHCQPIHDPFITNTTTLSRWDLFKGLWRGELRVRTRVSGSQAAQRAIMMLDPEELQRENAELLAQGKKIAFCEYGKVEAKA